MKESHALYLAWLDQMKKGCDITGDSNKVYLLALVKSKFMELVVNNENL